MCQLSPHNSVGKAVDCIPNNVDPSKVAYTITVDMSGQGNFTRVQDAINSIPSGNTQWIQIYVNSGTYKEKVLVDKPCIFLQGSDLRTTIIEWDDHQATNSSATFTSNAGNFVAKYISFKNSYNHKNIGPNDIAPAVAAEIVGDKSAFYYCGFYGFQDTLWDVSGRHYFESCYIEGAIDFIWGGGQSIYQNCHITFMGDALGGATGYITAQARDSADDPSGFVFNKGTVYGSGSALLGRAYRSYAKVIFHGTFFSDIVQPDGWDAWGYKGHEENIMFVEAGCHGPGADESKRVSWMKKFSPVEVKKLTDISFIDQDGWLNNQPS